MRKKAVDVAQFRQLCSLGVEPCSVMPSLLAAAHRLVSSERSAFAWADEHGAFDDVTLPYVLLPETASVFGYRMLARLPRAGVREALAARRRMRDLMCVSEQGRAASRYYSISRPGNHHQVLSLIARGERGRRLGKLVLARSAREPGFSDEERELLSRLLPYMVSALEPRKRSTEGYASVGAPGLVAITPEGLVSHAGKRAHALLLLADEADVRGSTDAPPVLLAQRLRASFRRLAGSGYATHAEVFEHWTQWGRFVFRCERLERKTSIGNALVMASIDHHRPVPLIRMRAMQAAGLSSRQMQVCLLLCEQRPIDDVASEAGVSRTTVKDHVTNIYLRFGVHTREELMSRLLTYGSIDPRPEDPGWTSRAMVLAALARARRS